MTSPRLGVVRDSMLTNPLLIKAPLGQVQSRGLAVPDPDFTFGTSSSLLSNGGVPGVLSSWTVQSRREDSAQRPNFVSLNRDAVKSGLVTSKELSQYRAQRGGATHRSPTPKQREGRASLRSAPDVTFGVTNRASSPLSDLLSNQYAHRWMDEQMSRNQTSNNKDKVKLGRAAETRTSLLRRSRSLPVTQTPFKLPHFTQVGPALDTFRDQEAHLRAFRAHQSDSVSRRGHQGLGTYGLE
ncbi:cilia- and flagella-associated protein 77 [Embiotoca jacksoni]|uniref:cilia- and flagella-associated protein 77 n=1 Tax=Embiotoca jacksoni TaxID=100190 RepID=UPI003703D031